MNKSHWQCQTDNYGNIWLLLCETKWLLLFLTVNTEKKPQNKTVERITIDPHLSHAQSHLNGRLFLPEEPAQTFKSTANARFSPLSLFLSLLKTAMLQLNVILAQAGRLGGAIKAWLHTLGFCLCFPLCCRHSSSRSLQFLVCGSPNPGTKCVCPTSWSSDANAETTTPHTTVEDDISSPPHPHSPPLVSPNPISKAWVFLIYWWPHTLTLSLQLCRTAHWQD